MAKSIDELENDPKVSLPERTYDLCVNGQLLARLQQLQNELGEEQIAQIRTRGGSVTVDGEVGGPPARLGQRSGDSPKALEIKSAIADLWDEMADYTGELLLRAMTPGTWTQWVDEHPPREKNKRDAEVARGVCNADDLIAALGEFAAAWNGEALKVGKFDTVLRPKAAYPDLKEIATIVVDMHEYGVDLPKLRLASLAAQASETD